MTDPPLLPEPDLAPSPSGCWGPLLTAAAVVAFIAYVLILWTAAAS